MTDTDAVVFVIDDDAQVREAFVNLCRSVGLEAKAFASTDDFMRAAPPDAPACLVLDIRFPGSAPSGLDFQRRLIEADNPIPIIFITGHGDVPMSVQAMKSGAVEFLLKPVREQDLLDAIRHGIERDRRRRAEEEFVAVARRRFDALTAREREIMALVTQGFLNKQIAAELGLSEITIKVHRSHVMQKMAARSLVDLVRMSDRLLPAPTVPPAVATRGSPP
jgi:FixJ family two-component response regulator